MARRSLKPQLNQIRTWVRQGRTDAWIAHQLEVPVQQIDSFKKEHDLLPEGTEAADLGHEVDLRAEDDALIAAELEAEEAVRAEEEAARVAEEAAARAEKDAARSDEDGDESDDEAPARRRGRRGGRARTRRTGPSALEGTFDHGEEGYGLWLDPAVADSAIYAEHWAGHRSVAVTIEEDQIVIRRAGDEDAAED